MTDADFLLSFPEFATAPEALRSAKLAEAARSVGEVFGDRQDDATALLAAHLLASAPMGQMARMQSQFASTTYGQRYEALRLEATAAIRVFP